MAVPFQFKMLRDIRDELAAPCKRIAATSDSYAMLRNMEALRFGASDCISCDCMYEVGANAKTPSYIDVHFTIRMKIRRPAVLPLNLRIKLDEVLAAAEWGWPEC